MIPLLLILIFCAHYSKAVIYHLNDSAFADLPLVFSLDPYEPCLRGRSGGGVYCSSEIHLVPDHHDDKSSLIFHTITEYTARNESHFDHTRLSHGICLTETCAEFYQSDETGDRRLILESCLNHTFWERYRLKVRVSDKTSCHTKDEKIPIDITEILVGVGIAALIILNIVGSLLDYCFTSSKETFWSCFSIFNNWRKLAAPPAVDPNSRAGRLQGLCGIKCVLAAMVILFHSLLPFSMNTENVHFLEESLNLGHYQMMASMGLLVQGFLVMSGMLMSYNLQIDQEKSELSWQTIRKNILHRWIRFSPRRIHLAN